LNKTGEYLTQNKIKDMFGGIIKDRLARAIVHAERSDYLLNHKGKSTGSLSQRQRRNRNK
jgi:hypothetical protein